jgi:hypothetical protein
MRFFPFGGPNPINQDAGKSRSSPPTLKQRSPLFGSVRHLFGLLPNALKISLRFAFGHFTASRNNDLRVFGRTNAFLLSPNKPFDFRP